MKKDQFAESTNPTRIGLSRFPRICWGKFYALVVLVFYSGITSLVANTDPQPNLKEEMVVLNVQDQKLADIFKVIEDQTSIHFAYDPQLVNQFTATIAGNPTSVENILSSILQGTPLEFDLIKDKILIQRVKAHQRPVENPVPGLSSEHNLSPVEQLPISVSGQVTDQDGEPLIGVNIQIKGTATGTITDFDGTYTLENVDENEILVFSYIGFQSQEVAVEGRSVIDVVLLPDAQLLDEVVVIGYGTVKKSDLTGSVASINAERFQNQPVTQVSEMLTGTVAGFSSNQSTSAAGGASMEVRGRNSLNASTTPMIVLDGVIYNGSLNDINPNDVASIDILKDASSAAVFGARAASGVVLITTKRGERGKPKINFSTKWGATAINTDHYGARSPQEYIDFRVDYFRTVDTDFPEFHYLSPKNLPSDVTLEQWRSTVPNPNENDEVEWLNRLNFTPVRLMPIYQGIRQIGTRKCFEPGFVRNLI